MTHTRERLELPVTTYRAIEQIAQIQGVTPAEAVDNLVRRFHRAENLTALREEYQHLATQRCAKVRVGSTDGGYGIIG